MNNIRPFFMPKWGIEMTEGTVAEWMVKEGDSFSKGQTLCLIETSKITNDVEAEYSGMVRRLLVGAGGEPQPVGTLLAVFADPAVSESDIDRFVAGFRSDASQQGAEPDGTAPAPTEPIHKADTGLTASPAALKLAKVEAMDLRSVEGSGDGGRITYQDVYQALRPLHSPTLKGAAPLVEEDPAILASPLARRLAALHGIALAGIKGSGPRGRISKADVLARIGDAAPTAAQGTVAFVAVDNRPEIVPFDRIRKIVASRLTEAKQQIPHFYLRISAQVDALVTLRKTANLVLGCKASINDYIVKAVAMALVRHPDVNVQVHGQTLHRFPHADISIAVASPKGLVTPVIRQADCMRIDQLALESRRLIEKAASGKLLMEEMEGGSFSVSNLGMMGVEQFDAIINPPQAAILAIGAIGRQPAESAAGAVVFESRIALSLSCDHRAIDGAAGAAFLQSLKGLIEAPEGLFQ